ncbi:hypothetical protein FRACYDRAFT_247252 [Fragilariopsis cylindrus CCMP1102]|uniref:Uncharacterized protein n=1 Tax=Fragilariopsis cylindrus CCMP1102 TaxID=635003 RepID=A0A1E7EWW5_9STRA|nr:hypothetical protein FRACYDRAFT_247252 [Fragilariopsis cylindrus CCMP1102]|eukprot:OEU10304.1 hypothetical protein FRACYDRAFT_247252 [Fragilariopsis cylindrus CCMP1102]
MTIRDNNSNNNKSFASAAPTTETDAVAFNVNAADDVFNEDNIPFAHASSVSTTTAANNSGYGQLNSNNNAGATTTTTNAAQRTPIAYSTGKPPQPPRSSSSSSSVAVATGAPTPTPTPIYATHTTRYNNSSECCTRWNSCGGITCAPMPTPTSATTKTTGTTTTSTRGNNSECCTGLTCCGITSIVLIWHVFGEFFKPRTLRNVEGPQVLRSPLRDIEERSKNKYLNQS